jgi:tRNA threonylcarbamoyladenosine biosynthesis protein TsaB
MPLHLAIETSQHHGSVAVQLPDGRIDSETLATKKRHDDDLLPAIDRLFARNNLKPRDLAGGAVAVSIGPGGFTGLRIAVATAKMFAEALGTKIIAVPSALVAAEAIPRANQTQTAESRQPKADCLVALSAKNNSFWLTRVEPNENHWQISPLHAPGIADAVSMSLDGIVAVLADEHFPPDARHRCEDENVSIIPPVFEATNCLAVAERMQKNGQFTDPLQLLPLYPRQPEAVTIWQQRANAETAKRRNAEQ